MTGCFPQAFPEEAQKLSEVDVLVGAGEKKKVLDYVNEYLQKGGAHRAHHPRTAGTRALSR